MRRRFLSFVAILFCLWLATPAGAPEARGTIQGRVCDASGGTIPGATISVTSRASRGSEP